MKNITVILNSLLIAFAVSGFVATMPDVMGAIHALLFIGALPLTTILYLKGTPSKKKSLHKQLLYGNIELAFTCIVWPAAIFSGFLESQKLTNVILFGLGVIPFLLNIFLILMKNKIPS